MTPWADPGHMARCGTGIATNPLWVKIIISDFVWSFKDRFATVCAADLVLGTGLISHPCFPAQICVGRWQDGSEDKHRHAGRAAALSHLPGAVQGATDAGVWSLVLPALYPVPPQSAAGEAPVPHVLPRSGLQSPGTQDCAGPCHQGAVEPEPGQSPPQSWPMHPTDADIESWNALAWKGP